MSDEKELIGRSISAVTRQSRIGFETRQNSAV